MFSRLGFSKFAAPLLLFAAASSSGLAQAAADSGHFTSFLQGKRIGVADYTLKPSSSGFSATAHFSFTVNSVELSITRQTTFDSNWELLKESSDANVNQSHQALLAAPNKARDKLAFNVDASGQQFHSDLDFHPNTVVLPNFDPSGVQVLLKMQAVHPAAGGNYWAFIPVGAGTVLPAKLTAAAPGEGTLNGDPIKLKHWKLQVGSVELEIWADATSALMQAAVASQAAAYTRDGFVLKSASSPAAAPAPAMPMPANIEERTVTFPSDGLQVPGTLTLPKDRDKPPPVVVLVQGSGVQDRDETVGANKIFQQLAWDLAAKGIATLRYDRRPKFAPQSFLAHFDLDHEVVIDAAAALAYCSTIPDVAPDQIFYLGHSLGAELGPDVVERRLAAQPGSVRGMMLLGGTGLGIDATLERQYAANGKSMGRSAEQIAATRAQLEAAFAKARDPKTPVTEKVGVPPVVIPAGYLRDWLARDPVAVMKAHPLPTLVLRGDKDDHVSHEDFALLAAAATAPCSSAKELPGLNHVFTPSEDELAASEVSPVVIATITQWIHAAMLPSCRSVAN